MACFRFRTTHTHTYIRVKTECECAKRISWGSQQIKYTFSFSIWAFWLLFLATCWVTGSMIVRPRVWTRMPLELHDIVVVWAAMQMKPVCVSVWRCLWNVGVVFCLIFVGLNEWMNTSSQAAAGSRYSRWQLSIAYTHHHLIISCHTNFCTLERARRCCLVCVLLLHCGTMRFTHNYLTPQVYNE